MSYDLSRALFSIQSKRFTCGDFLEALKFFGVYDEWHARVARSKSLLELAERDGKEIDRDALAEMTNEFRYSEKLLSSEEFNVWLSSVNLDLNDFESYLKRTFWSAEEDRHSEAGELPVSDSELFSELYFSRSFKGLLHSWQKRLLAWFDKNDSAFPGLEELNENYRQYEKELLDDFDKELWLVCFRNELAFYKLSCLTGDKNELKTYLDNHSEQSFKDIPENSPLKYLEVGLFYRDLPEQVRESLAGVKAGGLFGPVKLNEAFVLCCLESFTPASLEDADVMEELESLFISEVWKTLELKYVS